MAPVALCALLALGARPSARAGLGRSRLAVARATSEPSVAWEAATRLIGSSGVDISGDNGCVKAILSCGRPQEPNPFGISAGTPPIGARVQVHYVGWLPDGRQFDSSRDRGAPFQFVLGAGTVIRAWECAVSTMTVDEVAMLRCRADYAFGPYGFKPLVPPNATLDFELELLGWEDYDSGVQDVDGSNPFDDDENDEDVFIDLQQGDIDELARVSAAVEVEDTGPAKGRAVSAGGTAYAWEESEYGVTLFVQLPEALGSRDVSCTVSQREIRLEVPAAGISLSGPLKGPVHAADAYWLIDKDGEGGRCVQVYMDKVHELPSWGGVLLEEQAADAAGLLLEPEGGDGDSSLR